MLKYSWLYFRRIGVFPRPFLLKTFRTHWFYFTHKMSPATLITLLTNCPFVTFKKVFVFVEMVTTLIQSILEYQLCANLHTKTLCTFHNRIHYLLLSVYFKVDYKLLHYFFRWFDFFSVLKKVFVVLEYSWLYFQTYWSISASIFIEKLFEWLYFYFTHKMSPTTLITNYKISIRIWLNFPSEDLTFCHFMKKYLFLLKHSQL